MATKKRYCVSRATIEYGFAYVDAASEEEAIAIAKEEASFEFVEYSPDGHLEELTKDADGNPRVIEYEIAGEDDLVDEDPDRDRSDDDSDSYPDAARADGTDR